MGKLARGALIAALVGYASACGGPTAGSDGGADAGATVCSTDVDCDDGVFCNGVELCRPRAVGASASGCLAATAPRCLASQTCDELHATCVTDCTTGHDADGDGHGAVSCGGDDCDDADPHTYPGNAEICDEGNHDEDCDETTFGDRDLDHDGDPDARCCNVQRSDPTMLRCGDDCNDLRRVVNPSTTEACDGFDNDCDGAIDEGVRVMGYADQDRDGFGAGPGSMVCAGSVGFALDPGDCDDMDPANRPMGAELCDGHDNDCDTRIDETPTAVTWFRDLDGDAYGSARSGTVQSCTPVSGFSLLGTDCDDHARGVNPGANELCNGRDDDCNGMADFVVAPGDLEDDDMDGFVDARCPGAGDDCDDLDPSSHPGATEICDGRDNDCNGMGDDLTGMIAWYADADGDGWGDPTREPITSCVPPAGRVSRALDCDDSDPARFPGAADLCDQRDQDCDASVDEDAPTALYWMGDLDGDGYAGGAGVASCAPVPGATTVGGDCDDTRADRSPEAAELCNGADDDCDASTDEGFGTITCGVASCVRSVAACVGGAPVVCTPGTPAPELCNGADDDCDGRVDDEPGATSSCHLAGASSQCRMGTCHVLACNAGRSDCNHADGDGCETTLDSDALNCGACGNACDVGVACRAGRCANQIVDLALGDHHSCALLASGQVYCWGRNQHAQVGQNDTTTPYFASAHAVLQDANSGAFPPLDSAGGIDASHDTTCVWRDTTTDFQRVICWGDNYWGQTADRRGYSAMPVVPCGYWEGTHYPRPIVQIQMTATSQTARDDAGALWLTGYYPFVYTAYVTQRLDLSPTVSAVTEMHAGEGIIFARDASSTTQTYAWGDGRRGGFDGHSSGTSPQPIPVDVGPWRNLVVGGDHACALRVATSDVACWGRNDHGQLGRGDASAHTDIANTGTSGSVDMDAYLDTTCVANDAGEVVCWGMNDFGQCGTPGPADVLSPSLVPMPGGLAARLVGVGGHHACAVLATQQVVCWGQNTFGQLGNGTTTSSVAPVFVSGLP